MDIKTLTQMTNSVFIKDPVGETIPIFVLKTHVLKDVIKKIDNENSDKAVKTIMEGIDELFD